MALISAANFLAYWDRLSAAWLQAFSVICSKTGGATTPSVRKTISNMLADMVALGDFEQEQDLPPAVNVALAKATGEFMYGWMGPVIQSLQGHCNSRGSEVAASIVDIPSFLNYYNGGSGGNAFANMLTPEAAAIWLAEFSPTALPAAGVMSPALQPDLNPTYTNGMGKITIGGSFTAGSSVTTATYSCVVPVLEVLTAFSGGSGAITAQIAGTDDQGNAATWGPISLTGNNPAGALSGVTVTNAITAMTKVSQLCSSSTGIVVGSVLTINKNLPDQEVVVVEAVADSTHFTAAMKKAHGAGATVDGWNSYLAGNASTGAGRRCQALTGITFPTTNSQTTGVVRVAGRQDRVGI
jgi:hypothetical protein